jgi:NAD(P)-dependent dehydrogenase (short-subunit alcohol dehydrogenase family)
MRKDAETAGCRFNGWIAESSHGSGSQKIDGDARTSRTGFGRINATWSAMMTGSKKNRAKELFDLSGRVAIVTGGAGFLGNYHGAILAAAGAHVVLLDLPVANPAIRAAQLTETYEVRCCGLEADVTNEDSLKRIRSQIIEEFGRVDILINNAANNPKIGDSSEHAWSRLESLPLEVWDADIRVGLTGAFLCSRVFGAEMVKRGSGVIVNIASDLAVIAPDQRLYRIDGLPEDQQPVKPVTYSVVKTALLGPLATWQPTGVGQTFG